MAYVYDDNTGNYVWVPDEDPNQTAPPTNDQPPVTGPVAPPPTQQTATGKSPQEIEAEGRDYDRQHGLIGGYMSNGVWVNGSPHGGGTPGPEGTGTPNFQFEPSGWNFPQFNAPRFEFAPFESPAPFEFQKFNAPSMAEAEKEPGYAFARDQGMHALENNAAARGVLRSGGTMKDFISFGNKFAEQNYGNVFNRAKDIFNTNEGNRFNAYNSNFGNALNAYGANFNSASGVFDRNYKGSWDEYSSKMDASKTDFNGALQKWLAQLNAMTELSRPFE